MPDSSPNYYWDLNRVAFSLLPLAPGPRRKTLFEEVVKQSVYTMDQIQGIVNVNVPVRGVIVALKDGGLLVYNPVAPTVEVVEYMRYLEARHGPVRHIVLGSLGLEHKALCGPFTRYFPQAMCWQQPGQWSFPVSLPSFAFGFPIGRLRDIPTDGSNPWEADFDIAVLGPLKFKSVGGFGETAMFHRQSKTLLVTDAVIKVGSVAPPIILEDPRALLFHSRDKILDPVVDTEDARRKGWRRMTLFGLFFYPSGIKVSGFFETLRNIPLLKPEALLLGKGVLPISSGLYPWTWEPTGEEKNFQALQNGLLVAPILRKLILNREPAVVLRWVETLAQWGFKRIIPSHFENDIAATGKDFKLAYQFLMPSSSNNRGATPSGLRADYSLLDFLSGVFTSLGVVAASEIEE